MYTKILLVVVIIILSAFFYLHTQNPGSVTYIVTNEHTYTMPVTLLLFVAFFAGAILAVANSLLVDARRAIKEMSARKEKKLHAQAEESYKKGIDHLVKGDTSGARELMQKALSLKPAETGMIINLAETYIRESRPKEALKVLEEGLMRNPSSIGLLMAVARCAVDSGDPFRAAKAYDEVVRIDQKNIFALKKLRDLKMGAGHWDDSAYLQRLILDCELDHDNRRKEKRLLTGLLFETASKLTDDGRLNDAIAKVKDVLKNDDSFMPAHILLGEILVKQNNVQNAIKVWEKAHYKYPNSEPLLLKLEDIYIKESAPDKILEKYQRELIANPNDANLRLLLSRLYLRLEMVDNAIEELERLHLEGAEDSFYPQILLGEAYLRRKQTGRAAYLFQKALGLDRELMPPFVCSQCGFGTKSWSYRCPSCAEWNTMLMSSAQSPKAHQASHAPHTKIKQS